MSVFILLFMILTMFSSCGDYGYHPNYIISKDEDSSSHQEEVR